MIQPTPQLNAQYTLARPGSLPIRLAVYQRRRIYKIFLAATAVEASDSILDVGVASDQTYGHSNCLEEWYPYKHQITAVGIDDASFLEQTYPGMRFVKADGRDLPFRDGEFDYVHSSAVIEHVGGREMQIQFLRELWRVARNGIFVTTPNRWFPVEFHTVLPLVHWLPPATFRAILRYLGHELLAREENLNLMGPSDLLDAATMAGIVRSRVDYAYLAGWPSNLLLIAHKSGGL